MSESPLQRFSNTPLKPLVSILTASLPERLPMLLELQESVRAQTFKEWEHLVWVDHERVGCSKVDNALVREARADWVFLIADDDLLFPDCIEKHMALATGEIQIVYGPPEVEGEDGAQFCGQPPNIPATALIRKDLWVKLGGYDERLVATEDRDFYERAMRRDTFAKFARLDDTTWRYRFHGGNKSRK